MPIEPATPVAQVTPESRVRTDAHNIQVDETAATHHLCGTQHLATGRECRLPERHSGGCDFTLSEGGGTRISE